MDETNFKMVMWGFGLCATGFFFLSTCLWWIVRQIPDAKNIAHDLTEIKDALLGTMKSRGLMTTVHQIKEDVDHLQDRMNKLEGR